MWHSDDPAHQQLQDAIEKICAPFDDAYWLRQDTEGEFPHDFHRAIADGGWLGIAMPPEHGGAGLGITEAAIMMRTIAQTGVRGNRLLVGAVAVEVAVLAAFLSPTPLADLLDHAWPSAVGWMLALLAVPAVAMADTVHKQVRRRRGDRTSRAP